MPSRRAKPNARTPILLLALALCGAGASASAQSAPAATPAPSTAAEPLSVVLVVDTSASVRSSLDSGGKRLRQSLARFVEAGGGRDQFSLIEVTTTPALHLDWTDDGGEVSQALSKLLSKRKVGATALVDACALAVAKAAGGGHARRAVLVLSDGVDTTSELPVGEVEKLLKGAGVRLFAVEVGDRGAGGAYYGGGFRNLERLTAASGGAVYRLKKAGELDSILATVRAELGR